MVKSQQAISSVFKETSDFILVGLTGRTGSGCSTTAELLSSSDKMDLPGKSEIYKSDSDQRKYGIISRHIHKNWTPFTTIEVTTIITAFILEMDFHELVDFVSRELEVDSKDVDKHLECMKEEYEEIQPKTRHHSLLKNLEELGHEKVLNLYLENKKGSIRHLGIEIKKSLKRIEKMRILNYTKKLEIISELQGRLTMTVLTKKTYSP